MSWPNAFRSLRKACLAIHGSEDTIDAVFGIEKGAFMNFVTVADIKRSGFSVLEAALARGPVHLMKRNRPSAVLLSPSDYDLLVQQARRNAVAPVNAGLDILLAQDSASEGLSASAMHARLTEMGESWGER
jgi:prevent-host-death family protein